MKLSTRGRYGVMAMADLASQTGSGAVSLAEIAERQMISPAYLEQLFVRLRRQGLVESARGPGGGFRLARPADDIRIADIIEAVEEPTTITRCETGSETGCVGGARCLTHDLWEGLGQHIHDYLASVSLADVLQKRLPARIPNTGRPAELTH
ncbi:Rrf2 family transcriptional regulator [Rhodoligotrophos ferricapiens]|uniref:Rrf2 family transcriptional regulator n=1 Tax=Rhodoligotrophos ferricapiens TaxID=3069264 RepID=UPI00315D0329